MLLARLILPASNLDNKRVAKVYMAEQGWKSELSDDEAIEFFFDLALPREFN